MKTIPEMFASRIVKTTAIVIGIVLVALISFSGGLAVGFHKAKFSYAFGENYERNFANGKFQEKDGGRGMSRRDMMRDHDFEGKNFRNGHGISGEILSIADANIIIKDRDNKENTVSISEKTIIRNGRDSIQTSDLTIGTKVVIIGNPSDTGTIDADFIRVFASDNDEHGWGMINFRGKNQQ